MQQNLKVKIENIKKQAVILDIALGFEPEIEVPHKWDLFPRYQKAGFNYVALAIAGEFTSLETTIQYLSRHRTLIQNDPEHYLIVDKVEDILKAKKQNKIALSFWLQGSNPLAQDLNMVETYYKLGVRSILLCYNTRNAVGDGIIEAVDGGLSQFGHQLIAEMNRVGMLIDLSHTGIKTSLEAIEASKDPVIFSHSNAYQVAPHIRNLTDDQIKAIAKKDGVIGMNGASLLLGSEQSTSEKLADHIDYIANLVGTRHIALGLDLIYFHEILDLFYQKAGNTKYPKGYTPPHVDSLQIEKIDELIGVLINRGYSDSEVKNILGGNYLRIANAVWK